MYNKKKRERQMSAHTHLYHSDPDTMSLFHDGRGRQMCLKRAHGHTKDNLPPPPLAVFPKRSLKYLLHSVFARSIVAEEHEESGKVLTEGRVLLNGLAGRAMLPQFLRCCGILEPEPSWTTDRRSSHLPSSANVLMYLRYAVTS